MISIHALCEEGDPALKAAMPAAQKFLSTPSARRATDGVQLLEVDKLFLSTPSARRATGEFARASWNSENISIHALCEEGDWLQLGKNGRQDISIHALCEEGDKHIGKSGVPQERFLSTPSARRATSRPGPWWIG